MIIELTPKIKQDLITLGIIEGQYPSEITDKLKENNIPVFSPSEERIEITPLQAMHARSIVLTYISHNNLPEMQMSEVTAANTAISALLSNNIAPAAPSEVHTAQGFFDLSEDIKTPSEIHTTVDSDVLKPAHFLGANCQIPYDELPKKIQSNINKHKIVLSTKQVFKIDSIADSWNNIEWQTQQNILNECLPKLPERPKKDELPKVPPELPKRPPKKKELPEDPLMACIEAGTLKYVSYLAKKKFNMNKLLKTNHVNSNLENWKKLNRQELVKSLCEFFESEKEPDGWTEHSFKGLVAWELYNKYNDQGLRKIQADIVNQKPLEGKGIRGKCNSLFPKTSKDSVELLCKAVRAEFSPQPVQAAAQHSL